MSSPSLMALAPHVWLYPTHSDPSVVQPNIGVIRTTQQTILVDAGNSPRHARRVLADLYAQGFPPVRTLIYTHHHWDHVLGSTSYHPTRVIAHSLCAELLKAWTQRHWTTTMLREEMQRTPQYSARCQAMIDVLEDWRELRLAMPNITFTQDLTLYEDELTIRVRHVGGDHAPDSAVVEISTGVLFVGDSFYPGTAGDEHLNMTMLASYAASGASVIVDGHGPPHTPTEIRALIDDENARLV